MARIGKIKKTKEIHIIPESLELDVYYGFASNIEEAKERVTKIYKKEYGKDTEVFFDGVA